ncbi:MULTISPECIES: hypothetical protein [unclassified Bacillus (in: firmicutes)]|uniref:hypothetical protein n=1 Tax=unclassified Bacillus (in: firmicutes) TaxID=185979 RepID=UPI001BE518A8|nr:MULTISPECIES: hypothetical protein [unclassified Bacillus (in: firmicutes)]MBT2616125.1 hypothetical protein [Bacillus sp. ISL-78]MBT2628425.1 hypothetical protein [Bacillus sp. ISL-101]
MKIFTELMKNDQIKRSVLIKFGFGDVNKSEVEKWVKETYPEIYHKINKNLKSTKVVEFSPREAEMITEEERTAILDRVENYLESQNEKKVDRAYEDDLKEMMKLNDKLGYELEQYYELLSSFVHENDLGTKFYNFLKKKKKDEDDCGFVIDDQLYFMSLYFEANREQLVDEVDS